MTTIPQLQQIYSKQRSELRNSADCEFIDLEHYRDLAISCKNFQRCDIGNAGLLGFQDCQTGKRFMIEIEKINRYEISQDKKPKPHFPQR